MKGQVRKVWLLSAVLVIAACAFAQTSASKSKATDSEKGFTEIEAFQGTLNSSERLFKLDSNLGWDFNKHFGVYAGVPVYVVHVPSSTTTSGTGASTTPGSSSNGIGNVYFGLAFQAPNPMMDYASTVTAGAPTGDSKKGLSTGRGTIYWDNRVQHAFERLTPFFDAGIGNTVPDSALFTRAFSSLGFVARLEEGAEFGLLRHVGVGGSLYEIVPAGNQKVFSRLVQGGGTAAGSGKNSRVFETAAETSGNVLTRENGFSTWIGIDPAPVWRLELGYTRSVTFDLNSFAFNVSVNVGKLLRSKKAS